MTWMAAERTDLASGRILDAAADLFAERGVTAVGMADVAQAAGCARATLYRYFPTRDALRAAFVDREARRVAATVAADLPAGLDPEERLVELVVRTLEVVRSSPALAAWFRADALGAATRFASSSTVVGDAARDVLDDEAAAWLVRVIVSFLAMPAGELDDERRAVRRFVAPVLVDRPTLAAHGREQHT